MWKPPTRNFDKIQYEGYRKVVDGKYTKLHDDLSDCYYNFWKLGKSKVFDAGMTKYDKQDTVEESKTLFNDLHGLVGHLHEKALEDHHSAQPEEEKDPKYKLKLEQKPKRSEDRLKMIADLKLKGIEITK